jgi:uncharacterized protein (DUF1800 family)
MGQSLFRPPSVRGWGGGRAWISSGSWIARHNALVALVGDVEAEIGDLEHAFPSTKQDELPRRVLERLLPEGSGREFVAALERAARNARDTDEARRTVVALVLTSPEFQLF